MIGIEVVLEQIRDHYVSAYVQVIDRYQKEFSPTAVEALLELPNREDQPYVFRLQRMDLAGNVNGKIEFAEFNHENHLTFKPIEFVLANTLEVNMNPISWNAVEFDYIPQDEYLALIEKWASKWIDIKDSNQEDEYGLGGRIHSITYPECSNGKCTLSIDFGSASTGAIFEFLYVFVESKVKKVKIHSTTVLGAP